MANSCRRPRTPRGARSARPSSKTCRAPVSQFPRRPHVADFGHLEKGCTMKRRLPWVGETGFLPVQTRGPSGPPSLPAFWNLPLVTSSICGNTFTTSLSSSAPAGSTDASTSSFLIAGASYTPHLHGKQPARPRFKLALFLESQVRRYSRAF